ERRRSLASASSFAALRLAMRLPVDDWETAPLIQLLRNRQVRVDWCADRSPYPLATAASAIQSSRVFRGLDYLREALERVATEARSKSAENPSVEIAREVIERLADLVAPLEKAGPWPDQVERLHGLAQALGLDGPHDTALETLWDALEDHGAILA